MQKKNLKQVYTTVGYPAIRLYQFRSWIHPSYWTEKYLRRTLQLNMKNVSLIMN